MKKILFLLLVMGLNACNNDDDTPTNPIDQLPPPTQTGENTFGCLLDGEAFLPGGVTNPLDCVYQLINGERFFTVDAAKRNENFNLISLSLSTNAMEFVEGESYQLLENEVGNVYGQYFFSGNSSFTNTNQTGNLTITRLDLSEQIISGTFYFDIIDQNGDLRQIREGRFDKQFTQ